ncbi:isoprenyl transferase [Pelagibius litoralis]|uniref:Isoprenyl transferase n=1 Tax=Pelagibius litoralis TaxID=374515 RepID=A0A967C6L6_9PROT|nr:isoprenyl transferase [Pelagibius litoralis]NIA67297.1 isoprenyl transferase [Pelagibius litoralis]
MDELPFSSDPAVPRHVAIIMDGNGRWANARGMPRTLGHRQGAEAVRRCISGAIELGIPFLTLFGFSSENWRRPMTEVADLMGLLRRYLQSELAEIHKNGIRLRVIGDRARLPDDIVRLIDDAEARTRDNQRLNLMIAISYGSRQEIAEAARRLAEAVRDGELQPSEIDEDLFAQGLLTAGIPDPDLVIRTSGEQRLSNFLLWQAAYSELIFVDKLWPDFDKSDLLAAVEEYQRRDRRYGAAAESQ